MVQQIKRRAFIKTATAFSLGIGASRTGFSSMMEIKTSELVVVEKGHMRIPIITAADATEEVRRTAGELAEYIGKISGARPDVLHGIKSIPESAVWVGIQPQLLKVFHGLNFNFQYPEEILIACNGRHLVIAGRDIFFENIQIEYGTANAVYTFLEKYLDVRWLWPGELGEDIIPRDTIAIPSFEYRFHPNLLTRRLFIRAERNTLTDDWTRYQRLKLDSLKGPAGGHAYKTWWERFHKDHAGWFALQPDGTRSSYPDPEMAKICVSNPEVWDQWLADAEDSLKESPELNMLRATENDGHSSGICVCKNCRAWDHPQGTPWTYHYEGHTEEYVAMTERYITFWNHLAHKLKERFPERDNLYVRVSAYGPSTPPSVEAVLADNTILAYVGKFPTIDENTRQLEKAELKEWAKTGAKLLYRPNLWYWTGGIWGLPDMALKNVMEDFRFLAENNCIGLIFDTAQEHFSTQGPQYYLMAKLAWDPYQDGQAIMEDYYRRGFGKAAEKISAYWNLMEEAREKVTASPEFAVFAGRDSDALRIRVTLINLFTEVYTDAFLNRADNLIRQADALVAEEPEIYRERVDFVRTGLEFTRLMVNNIPLMAKVRESGGKDTEAVNKVNANWAAIKKLYEHAGPIALNYDLVLGKMQGPTFMGNMEDYFGPPSEKFLRGTETG